MSAHANSATVEGSGTEVVGDAVQRAQNDAGVVLVEGASIAPPGPAPMTASSSM
jgi:hypothetical protein